MIGRQYGTVLYCTILYGTVQYCTVLYCIKVLQTDGKWDRLTKNTLFYYI